MQEDLTISQIKKRITHSFLSLTLRRVLIYAIRFFTINIILASRLPPETIGVFNIANSVLAFFAYFSDIGLGAALIQKKELTEEDLKTTFSIQVILGLLIFLIIFMAAQSLSQFYGLGESGVWLIRALGFGFLLISLKVLPSILLERNLRFGKLVVVEILETAFFSAVLITLTFQDFGVSSFSYAVLTQNIIGVIVIYLIAPWKIRVGISKEAAKVLLNFGVPFQLNSLLALLKDRLVVLVVAKMIGSAGVGLVTWSQSIIFVSLEVMNIINRITFPAFARLQNDKKHLAQALEKSIFFSSLFAYPILFGVMATAPSLVEHVVLKSYTNALPLIYLFAITVFWSLLSSTFTSFFQAVGKVKLVLKFMVMWTALEWALTPLLVLKLGFLGVGVASAIISFSGIILVVIIKRMIEFKILRNISRSFLAASLMGLITYFLTTKFVTDKISLVVVIFSGALIYIILAWILMRSQIRENLKDLQNA